MLIKSTQPFAHWAMQAKVMILSGLVVTAVILSAVSVIYLSHYSRQVFNDYQGQLRLRDELKIEWGRLLLEENTLASHAKIEQKAINELDMRVPDAKQVVIVRP